MATLIVVADLKIKEECIDEVLEGLKTLHEQTHKNDTGCIKYELHKNCEDQTSFTFIEEWENEEVLSKHLQQEHYLTFAKMAETKLESAKIQKLEKIL